HIRTLGIVGKIGGKAKLFRHFISSGRRESHVQPIVAEMTGSYLRTIGRNCPDMITGKAAYRIAFGIIYRQVLSCQTLVLEACAIIHIPLISDIPIVSSIKSQFVFMSFVIFGSILVQIIIRSISVMMNILRIGTVQHLGIFFYRMVV